LSFVTFGDVRQAHDGDGNKSHKKQKITARGDFAGAKALVKEREDKCHKYFTRIKKSRGLVARGTTTIKGIKVLKLDIPKEDMLQDDEDESMFDRVSCKVVPPALGHSRQIVWENGETESLVAYTRKNAVAIYKPGEEEKAVALSTRARGALR